ncbi:uncharacterized protein [Argopecten irradians]|uniref:uncharacterized protein n=1 Tax=Argopecten irradians TaxID=31199 RepID=UPI003721BE1D
MDDYVNASRDRCNEVHHNDTVDIALEDYDEATVSPTLCKMTSNMPKQPIRQTNTKEECDDSMISIQTKPQTTPIPPPPPPKRKCSTILTASIHAILIIAVVVAIPLGVIYSSKQQETSCTADLASGLTLEGNTTVEEGERYSIKCSGRLATEGGSLDLYVKSRNSYDFVRFDAIPTTKTDDVDDFCYSSVTKTYYLLAESDLNGTEFRCVATNDKLSSYQNTSSTDLLVDFADFITSFHLETATWIPAYADPESLEFKTFAMTVEYETDYVYSHSVLKNNYRKSKVISLRYGSVIAKLAMHIKPEVTIDDGSGNKITTKLTPADVEKAMRDTLPKVSEDLTVITGTNKITTYNGVNNVFSCAAKTDVVFLLDASGSIGDENFILMKYFVQNFTAGVLLGPEYIQIGLVKYSTVPNNEFWLNEYHGVTGNHSIAKAINNTEYTGALTYIARGLEFVRSYSLNAVNGARENASKVIILMTDGKATDEPAQIAGILKREGVLIACVAIGDGIRYDELQSIAYNDTYIFNASDFQVLAGIAATVKQSSCEINNNL